MTRCKFMGIFSMHLTKITNSLVVEAKEAVVVATPPSHSSSSNDSISTSQCSSTLSNTPPTVRRGPPATHSCRNPTSSVMLASCDGRWSLARRVISLAVSEKHLKAAPVMRWVLASPQFGQLLCMCSVMAAFIWAIFSDGDSYYRISKYNINFIMVKVKEKLPVLTS